MNLQENQQHLMDLLVFIALVWKRLKVVMFCFGSDEVLVASITTRIVVIPIKKGTLLQNKT